MSQNTIHVNYGGSDSVRLPRELGSLRIANGGEGNVEVFGLLKKSREILKPGDVGIYRDKGKGWRKYAR